MVRGAFRYRNIITGSVKSRFTHYTRLFLMVILVFTVSIILIWNLWGSLLDLFPLELDTLTLAIALIALITAIYEINENVRGGHLSATLESLDKLDSIEMRKARYLLYDSVENDWLKDAEKKVQVKQLMAHMNQVGLLISRNLIDRWMVMELLHQPIIDTWNMLESYIVKIREEKQYPQYMMHFTYLCEECEQWKQEHNLK